MFVKYRADSCRDHLVYAPSQWVATLHCNVVSHWLGAYTRWSLQRSTLHSTYFSSPFGSAQHLTSNTILSTSPKFTWRCGKYILPQIIIKLAKFWHRSASQSHNAYLSKRTPQWQGFNSLIRKTSFCKISREVSKAWDWVLTWSHCSELSHEPRQQCVRYASQISKWLEYSNPTYRGFETLRDLVARRLTVWWIEVLSSIHTSPVRGIDFQPLGYATGLEWESWILFYIQF